MRTVNLLSPEHRTGPGLRFLLTPRRAGHLCAALAVTLYAGSAAMDLSRLERMASDRSRELSRLQSERAVSDESAKAQHRHRLAQKAIAAHKASLPVGAMLVALLESSDSSIAFDEIRIGSSSGHRGILGGRGVGASQSTLRLSIQGRGSTSLDVVRFAGRLASHAFFRGIDSREIEAGQSHRHPWSAFEIRAEVHPAAASTRMEPSQ